MARINFDERLRNFEEDFDRPRLRRRARRGRGLRFKLKLGCCLGFLILLIFAGVISLAAVAKTGLIKIPILSDFLYQVPEVTRSVSASEISQAEINSKLSDVSQSSSIELTEEELTFVFRQTLTGRVDSYFAPGLQVVVTNDYLEFFGMLTKPVPANIILKLQPYLENNQLKFTLVQASLGNLAMPPDTANWLLSEVFGSKLQAISQEIQKLNPQELELAEGKIILRLAPK